MKKVTKIKLLEMYFYNDNCCEDNSFYNDSHCKILFQSFNNKSLSNS